MFWTVGPGLLGSRTSQAHIHYKYFGQEILDVGGGGGGGGLHPLAPLFHRIGIGTHMLHDALHTQVPCLGVKLTHHIYVRTNVYGVWLITSCSTHKDTHVLKSEQSPSMYICQRDC